MLKKGYVEIFLINDDIVHQSELSRYFEASLHMSINTLLYTTLIEQ